MAELVYAFDLKSNGEIRAGSIPAPSTIDVMYFRGLAQPGSAHAWGAWGQEFKSPNPDQTRSRVKRKLAFLSEATQFGLLLRSKRKDPCFQGVAQLVARSVRDAEVVGSSPITQTIFYGIILQQ